MLRWRFQEVLDELPRQLSHTEREAAAAALAQDIASSAVVASCWSYEPRFQLHTLVQRFLAEHAHLVRSAAADLQKCIALLSV